MKIIKELIPHQLRSIINNKKFYFEFKCFKKIQRGVNEFLGKIDFNLTPRNGFTASKVTLFTWKLCFKFNYLDY